MSASCVVVLVVIATAAEIRAAAPFALAVTRRDLRPLPGVTLQVAGIVNRQAVTDENGHADLPDLPPVGQITITPSRSGFRFEPAQVTIPNLANSSTASFVAFPTATDLALSITSDNAAPLVGAVVNAVITLRNAGVEAATDIAVSFNSLPGLVQENAEATQGGLEFQAYQTVWTLSQLDPGASAEVRIRSRATLPDADVFTIAAIDEMDQTDLDPLTNSAELITHPRAATARLNLAMTINPATAKVGETIPLRLTLRNEGPNDATQIFIRSYTPPGASFVAGPGGLDGRVVVPYLAAGGEVQLTGAMLVRFTGTFTLIANVTSFEQQLPAGAAWPEARGDFTVQPAYSRISLFAFTDPPNPRVGDDINVLYVARNDGPDTVTGLKLFTHEDSRLGPALTVEPNHAPPPVPGPFVFGNVLPVGSYTYLHFRYSVKAAGDLTNYFTVEYQDQLIPNAADHPELNLPIKTLPADVGLSLDADPNEITARPGDPVTIDFPVHNDGPQAAHGLLVNFDIDGLAITALDEIIRADRVDRTATPGYIDLLDAGETVRVRKHFVASRSGLYTNVAEIALSRQRVDLLAPIAIKTVRLNVLPEPSLPPDLAIQVSVDKPQVNVGEYAIFIVTITNRAAQPAFNVSVHETSATEADLAFETVRSYGPGGDDRANTASDRIIPRIEPGGSYSMSRTMRVRKPVTITYAAKIKSVNGLSEADLPPWFVTTETTGAQVTGDIEVTAVANRTNAKAGDFVTFLVKERNLSPHIASHIGLFGGVGAGFQILYSDLGSYGYYFDWARPHDLQSGAKALSEWYEIRSRELLYIFFSAYTTDAGQLTMAAQLSQLDQLDGQAANDLTQIQINSAPASARISLRQATLGPNAGVGQTVPFVTEIRNEGPDRVTGLALVESVSANLELTYDSAVTGDSGEVVTSFLDSYVRLPALEPGQNFVWQRSYSARSAGTASRRVQVAGFDQTSVGPLADNEASVTIQPTQADLQFEWLSPPATAQADVPTALNLRVRNLGPATATRVRVALTADGLTFSGFGYGPRANADLLGGPNTFQTQLIPGESATVGFNATPTRDGTVTAFVRVQQSDQIDPNPANDTPSLTLNASPAPPIPSILRLRKVRTDFFDQTPIAEVEVDQAALDRLAPFTTFSLEASSNLRDWEFLKNVGLFPLVPVTFTDHVPPGVTGRAYRLRR